MAWLPELVGEHVGVGGDAGHGAGHVVVEGVDLLRVEDLVQELVGVPPLCGQQDAVVGQNACDEIENPNKINFCQTGKPGAVSF